MLNNNQANIQIMELQPAKPKKQYGYLVMAFLLASLIFISIPQAFEMINGRNVVGATSSPSTTFWGYVLFLTALSWVGFELLMRCYYFFASLSMYTFVIPKKEAHQTLRLSFGVRNLFVGALRFLLFASPIFINYIPFFTIIIEFCTLCLAFWILKKKYLGILLAPFAWRSFVRPYIIYEILMIAISIGGVL